MIVKLKAGIKKWMKDQGDNGHVDPEGMDVIKYQEYQFPYPKNESKKQQTIYFHTEVAHNNKMVLIGSSLNTH